MYEGRECGWMDGMARGCRGPEADFGPRCPRPGGAFETLPQRPGQGGRFETLPRDGAPGEPWRTLPHFGGNDVPRGGRRAPGMPGRPGHPPFGGPNRPNPDFLKERVEEADLSQLLELAGRLVQQRPEGIAARGQALILSILAGREALSQQALQQMLGVQPGSLSEILTKLERKGFIQRQKAEDRRGNLLRITEAGRQAIPEIEQGDGDGWFSALDAAQQEQLSDMLRSLLYDWIDRLPERPTPRRPMPDPGRPVPIDHDDGVKI